MKRLLLVVFTLGLMSVPSMSQRGAVNEGQAQARVILFSHITAIE